MCITVLYMNYIILGNLIWAIYTLKCSVSPLDLLKHFISHDKIFKLVVFKITN